MRLGNEHMVTMAEAICREHERRHRDISNAITDFRTADSDDLRVQMARDLMDTTRHAEHRFVHNMSDVSVKCIEKATGKTMDELLREGFAAFGIGIGPDGQPELLGIDENDDGVELEAPITSEKDIIEGLDMSSLPDFAAIEAEFKNGGGAA